MSVVDYSTEFVVMQADSPNLLDTALAYAERDFYVIPLHYMTENGCSCPKGKKCESPAKHPIASRGLKDATTNPDSIRGWWSAYPEANIGIATGEQSNLLVVDLDGKAGMNAFKNAIPMGESYPETLMAKSGREDGGRHLYFQHPGIPVKNAVKILPGVDIRSDGGYIIAPPSTHASGNQYQWENDLEPAPLPAWLLAKLQESRERTSHTPGERYGKGQRDSSLMRLAGGMRRDGMTEEEIYAALSIVNANRCDDPLPESDVEWIALSAASYTPPPELATFPPTDLGNGERYHHMHSGSVAYLKQGNTWLVYDGGA